MSQMGTLMSNAHETAVHMIYYVYCPRLLSTVPASLGTKDSQRAGEAGWPATFMRSSVQILISPILDLNPIERARTELKLAPSFLVRSAPKPRRVVDRVGT